jgi:hypothetical protein
MFLVDTLLITGFQPPFSRGQALRWNDKILVSFEIISHQRLYTIFNNVPQNPEYSNSPAVISKFGEITTNQNLN